MDYDAIVVGAGYAGITAARDLRDRGLSVLILEARDRIGGRAYTRQMRGREEMIEMGATFYDAVTEHNVQREVERYSIPSAPGIEIGGSEVTFFTGGERRKGLPVPLDEVPGLERAWIETAIAARRVHGYLPLDDQRVGDLDVTVEEFLAPLNLGPASRDLVAASVTPFFGDTAHASFLHYLEKIAGYGSTPWSLRAHHALRFAEGSAHILREMLADAKPDLELSAPVERIEHRDQGVRVRTVAGSEITGRTCVLTVPKTAPVMERIEIDPPLDPAKRRIIGAPNHSRSYKITFVAENLPGPVHCIGHPAPLCIIWTLSEPAAGQYLCSGIGSHYSQGGDPAALETAEAAIRCYIPEARVIASDAHDWGADPWSGSVGTIRDAGTWLGSRKTLMEPEGRLVLAGADVAQSPYHNLLDGAIESGHQAADRVSQLLGTWASARGAVGGARG